MVCIIDYGAHMKSLQDSPSSARNTGKRRSYDAAFKRRLVELSLVARRVGGEDRAGSSAEREHAV